MECTSPALVLCSHHRLCTPPRCSFSCTPPWGFVESLKHFYSPLLHEAFKSITSDIWWQIAAKKNNKKRKTVWLSLPPLLNSLLQPYLHSLSLHVLLSLGIASGTSCSPVNWPRPWLQHATETQLRLLVPQILKVLHCIPMSAEHFSCLVSVGLISVTACIIESLSRSFFRHCTARWACSHTVCGPSWQLVLRL